MTPSLKASSRLLGTSRGYPRQRGAAAARSRGIRVPPARAESELAVDPHHLVGAIAFIIGALQIQRPLRRRLEPRSGAGAVRAVTTPIARLDSRLESPTGRRTRGRWRGQPSSEGGRHGIRSTPGLRWPAPVAGDPARVPPRPPAAQQGPSLPARPADRGGDHRRDARCRRRPRWAAIARCDRDALAGRAADQRSARAGRERPGPCERRFKVRHGKGGRRREVGMDRWAWEHLDPWLNVRAGLPIGALFCVLRGPTRGRPCSAAGVRASCATRRHSRGASPVRASSAPARACGRDERNATLNYRSVLARELTATDARLYGRTRRQRRSRRSTTDD